MKAEFVKVTAKITADTFGCEPAYFKKYIKGKPLKIINQTSSHYVRVTDQNEEEWGLYPKEYALITGLEVSESTQKS